MEFPKNCWECKHSDNCKGPYYGGSYCSFKKEINEHIIAKTLGEKDIKAISDVDWVNI